MSKLADLQQKGKILNAVVRSATLGVEDHGILSSFVNVDRQDGGSQGFGGLGLYLPPDFAHHKLLSHAGHFIFRVLQIAGAEDWKDLPGKTMRIMATWDRIYAIGHIINDDWFMPEIDFKEAE